MAYLAVNGSCIYYCIVNTWVRCRRIYETDTRPSTRVSSCFRCPAVSDEKIHQIWLFRVIPNLQCNKIVAVLTFSSLNVRCARSSGGAGCMRARIRIQSIELYMYPLLPVGSSFPATTHTVAHGFLEIFCVQQVFPRCGHIAPAPVLFVCNSIRYTY